MAKVYPRVNTSSTAPPVPSSTLNNTYVLDNIADVMNPIMLTVWKKSLLFNCDGFTVFDEQGNLVYRVDNYVPAATDIVLMDASGNSLLTIRRKKRRFGADSSWMVYQGEEIDTPIFSVTKNSNFLSRNKCVAHVQGNSSYEVEGSFCWRCCRVNDDKGRKVAEIKQKEAPVRGVALGMDIFTLVVQPGLVDTSLAMAFVILLDQMFGSSSTSRRLLPNLKS